MTFQPLDGESIQDALRGQEIGSRIVVADCTESTNDDALKFGKEGAPGGLVIFAEEQTSGRGRRGSQWVSPPGHNLLCSVLTRPEFPMEDWSRLTHAAALAICLALEAAGLRPQIKWPNDVWVGGRKIAGILLEVSSGSGGAFAVIGLGLNVNLAASDLPADLREIATSMQIELGHEVSREDTAQAMLRHLERCCLAAATDFQGVLEEVRKRSLLLGKRVILTRGDRAETGWVDGLTDHGALLFRQTAVSPEVVLTADNVRLAVE